MCGFIKEWIENWKEDQKINSEIENPGNMSDLLKIVAMKDPEYVKEFIEYNEEILEECYIYGDRAVDLIKTVGDPEYIKECLENVEKMQALDIKGDRAVALIKATEDPEYIKECLGNVEKMKALDIKGDRAVDLIKTVRDPEYIKELLENTEKREALDIKGDRAVDLIKTVRDPEYIKELLENTEKREALDIKGDRAVDLIKTVRDPEYIKELLENTEKREALDIKGDRAVDLIKTVRDPEYIKELLENTEKREALGIYDFAAVELTKIVEEKEPGYIKELLENTEKRKALGIYDFAAVELTKIVEEKEPGYIKELLENTEKRKALGYDVRTVELIKIVGEKEPEYIKELLENAEKREALHIYGDNAVELIKKVEEKEPGYIIKYCLGNKEKMQALKISDDGVAELIEIVNNKGSESIIECINNKKLNESAISLLKQKKETEFIKENLKIFFMGYGFEEKDISSKAEILEQMYEINDEVYQKLDFRLLDNKYLRLLGEDKINQIGCYPEVQELVLKLNEKNLKAWAKCIDTYMHNNGTEEWTVIANEILNNLSNGQYDDLIENIDNLDNADINKLIKVLQRENLFGIKCEKDLENFELIKQQRCDKLIQSSEIGDKKLAVLEKLFGTDDGYAESLLRRYEQGINSLPESEPKNFIKSIQMLMHCQSGEILEQIYNECEETVFIDKVSIEQALKKEYAKLYNEGLFKIEDAVPIGENMYSAGTDFKMIITSLESYSEKIRRGNYKNDWNRAQISSPHLSASYIRQDMMGTALIRDICYGFDCMREDSLVLSGPRDICSSRNSSMVSICRDDEMYFVPDEQINHTCLYNEMDFRRIQGGEKNNQVI